ncbi:DUF4435 domain-containing protein [Microcoleus sp. herbarium2]|uniref:DUF4435 domain-containing protein n=1 Tax=Microcoleus sp. herbarium2 TaxID=3055433 RepID=UPI002FD33584
MEDEKRRKLDELVARYELEPSLHDVYVEGLTDKSIIQWFLDESNLDTKNCAVYEIDTVDIPTDQLFALGLNDSNRSRVIFLAFQLQRLFETSLPHVVCIADRDFDDLIGSSSIESELLLFTDYTSIEMYLFDSNIIEKFLRLALHRDDLAAVNILENISPILEEMFLLRAANESLSYGMEWLSLPSLKRCFNKRKRGQIEFDSKDFVDKYLNKNNRSSEKIAFLDKVKELRNKNISEIRNKIRGHDFIELFCWYIEPYLPNNKKGFTESEIAFAALRCCLDVDYLMQEKLFQELIRRVSK